MNHAAVIDAIISAAQCTEIVVMVSCEQTQFLRWANSRPTSNGDTIATQVTITAFDARTDGWAIATASGDIDDWEKLLASAQHQAAGSVTMPEVTPLLAGAPSCDWHLPPSTPPAFAVAEALGAAFAHKQVSWFGYAEQETLTSYVGTSTGWRWRHETRQARFEISAKSADWQQSAWSGQAGQTFAEIDIDTAIASCRRGLAAQTRHINHEPVATDVILTPSAVADLMICLWWEANLRPATENRSVFSGTGLAGTRLHEQLTERNITLRSDPFDPTMPTCDRYLGFDIDDMGSVCDTGASLNPVAWVQSGRLNALRASRKTAADHGVPAVVAADNLRLVDAEGQGSLADLISRTEKALLITSLWYIRDVDPARLLVTGLTRDGVYQVENGHIVGAVNNFRFNDSPVELMSRIVDASETQRTLPREWADYVTTTAMPALLVRDFGLSSRSKSV